MKQREFYRTKQKDIIINKIKEYNGEFTVKEIYEALNKEIGLVTIYRLVDKLVKDNSLAKIIGKDNIVYYQYLEECESKNHFFLKCELCGVMEHIDCDCIGELSEHISKKHSFSLTNHLIINGICKNCEKVHNK